METFEPRMLMSAIQSVTFPTGAVTFDTAHIFANYIPVSVHWVNHEPANLVTHVSLEIKEAGSSNFFTIATLLANQTQYDFTNSSDLTLQMDSTYSLYICTYTVDGSTTSSMLTFSTPNWASAGFYNYSSGNVVGWNDSANGSDAAGMTLFDRSSQNPYPQRWSIAGSANPILANYDGAFTENASKNIDDISDGAWLATSRSTVLIPGNDQTVADSASPEPLGGMATPNFTASIASGTITLTWTGTANQFSILDLGWDGLGGATSNSWSNTIHADSPHSLLRSGLYAIAAADYDGGILTAQSYRTSYVDARMATTPDFINVSLPTAGRDVVTWEDSSDNETGYEVWRLAGGGSIGTGTSSGWTLVATLPADSTSLIDTGKNANGSSIGPLQQDQFYTYEVRAIRANSQLDSAFNSTSVISYSNFCLPCLLSSIHLGAGQAGAAVSGGGGGAFNNGSTYIPLTELAEGADPDFFEQPVMGADESAGMFGLGSSSGAVPRLQRFAYADGSDAANIVISAGGQRYAWSDFGGSSSPLGGNPFSLDRTFSGGTYHYKMTDGMGDTFSFDVQGGSELGQFQQRVSPAGFVETASYSNGQLTTLTDAIPGGTGGNYQTLTYTYNSTNSDEPVASVAFSQNGGSAIESQAYTYSSGHLLTVVDTTSNGRTTGAIVRYNGTENSGQIEYVVSGDNYDRFVRDNGTNVQTADLTNFADIHNQYDDQGRLTITTVQAGGCSLCTGGLGTTIFTYGSSGFVPDFNTWSTKRTEYQPGYDFNDSTNTMNSVIVTYSNYLGQTLLQATVQTATGAHWLDYYAYDSYSGQQVLHAHPSAVTGYREDYRDLVDQYSYAGTFSYGSTLASNLEYISDDSGLIEGTTYISLNTGIGTGLFPYSTYILNGDGAGSPTVHYQCHFNYGSPHVFSANGTNIYTQELTESVVFSGDVSSSPSQSSPSALTTHYDYSWNDDSSASTSFLQMITVTNATVSTSHNGSGLAEISKSVMDSFGRTIWTMDADGFINYTQYDSLTGAVVKSITDVNTSQTSNFFDLPSGWASPSTTSALNLTTTFQVDDQGRTTEMTDPNGNQSYTVYDDAHHAVFNFSGAQLNLVSGNGTLVTTGPITMSHGQIPYKYQRVAFSGTGSTTLTLTGMYSESLSFSGTVTVTSNQIVLPSWSTANGYVLSLIGSGNATSPQYTLQSLSRSLENSATQMVESDAYYNISNTTYLNTATGSAYSGSATANFYATHFDYNMQGNQARTVSPTGTITIETYDLLGRLVGTYVGTSDSPDSDLNGSGGAGNWEDFIYSVNANPMSIPSGTDMTLVSYNRYDNAGVGDSNLTETIVYPNADPNALELHRVTKYLYDWRDRLITTIQPNFSPPGTHTLITINTLDNLGEVTGTYTFDNLIHSSGTLLNDSIAHTGYSTIEGYPETVTVSGNFWGYSSGSIDFTWDEDAGGWVGDGGDVLGTIQFLQDFNSEDFYWLIADGTSSPSAYFTWDGRSDQIQISGSSLWGDGNGDGNSNGIPDSMEVGSGGVVTEPTITSDGLVAAATRLYDEQGRAFRSTTYNVNPSDGSFSTASADTIVSNVWFDQRGNQLASNTSGGPTTKMTYDGAGRLKVSYVTDGGAVGNGGILLGTWADANSVSNDIVLSQIEYTYDANSNVILTTDRERFHDNATTSIGSLLSANDTTGHNARVSYVATYYDAANRTIETVNVGTNGAAAYTRPTVANSTVNTRSDTLLITNYSYNAAGQVETVVDPRGLASKMLFDALGRQTKTLANYNASINSGNASGSFNQTTLYTYDGASHVLTMTAVMPTGTPSQTTSYLYGVTTIQGSAINSNDLLYQIRYPIASGGSAGQPGTDGAHTDTFTYDAVGAVLTKTDRNGTIHSYGYDVLGRQTSDSVSFLGGASQNVDTSILRIENAYNAQGLLDTVTSFSNATGGSDAIVNQVQNTYNGFGQLTAQYQDHGGAVGGGTVAVQYAYSDGAHGSRLTGITYPHNSSVSYTYGSANSLNDVIGRLDAMQQGTVTLESYKYLGLSTVVERDQPGMKLTYILQGMEVTGDAGDKYTGLDRFGRVVDQRWLENASGNAIDRTKYVYDRDSNVVTKTNVLHGDFTENYTYNGLSQLTAVDRALGNASDQSWTLDALGNMTRVTTGGVALNRAINSNNQILSMNGTALTYDNAGDMTTDDQGHTLVWDAWNRLVAVTSGGSTLASYSYDGFGHEIRKTVSGTTTDLYLSASWQVLEEDQGSQAVERDVYSPVYVDALVLRDRDTDADGSLDERLFVTTDANFNVTAIANNSGVVQERFTYSAYGIRTDLNASFVASADSRAWVVGWQGLRWDADTGMFYARHRWYSPTQMRWTSWDLIGYGDGMNPYLADAANPINRVDPKGLKQVQLDADAFIPWDWVQVPITLPINMLMSLTDIVDNLDYGVRSTVAGALLGPLGPGVVGPPPKPSPTFTSYVAGDGRGFSLTPRAHHRIATGVTIETDSLLSPTGEVAGSYYRDIGSSTARYDATSGGATATILKYSALGTLTDSHSVIRTSPCSVHVHLEANGSVPQVVAPIVGFVGIDYSYDFDVSAVGGRTVVSMSGAHDRFPAHEVYATAGGRSQLMHAFTPSLVLRAPGVPIAIPYVGPPLKLAGIIPPIPVFGWVLF